MYRHASILTNTKTFSNTDQREVTLSPKGLIHGEQTQCRRKQDALRRAAVNMHLEPIPGLTLSFAAAVILLDLATQKILGKVGEGK